MAWELVSLSPAFPDSSAWFGFAYLTVICSVVGYDFWNRAVPQLGPNAINNLLYLLPLVGVLTGVLTLDEPVTPALFQGGGLILGGVFLSRRGQRQTGYRESCKAT